MNIDIVEIIIIAILITLIAVLLTSTIILKIKKTKLISVIAQLFIDKNVISEELDRLSFVVNNGPSIENDFIKFLSDSRDSAYEYIEKVQGSIESLYKAMESDKASEIDKAYKELIKFLPSKNMDTVE
jgi:biopolymer transport protein ExbB/TolQ